MFLFVTTSALIVAVGASSTEKKARKATLEFLEDFRDEIKYLKDVWPDDDDEWDFCDSVPHITCDASGMASIDLSGVGLHGELPEPDDDEELVMIKSIDMSNNPGLRGSLEKDWGKLARLEAINLSGTGVSGSLPSSWSRLSNLRTLTLANTFVSGSLPDSWSGMGQLTTLDLSGTGVSGALPGKWGLLWNLRTLSLSSTRLSGTVPLAWSMGMQKLQVLNISNTGLTNVLSSLTTNVPFPALTSLDVSHPTSPSCGSLPSELAVWAGTRLEHLNFRGHRYCGCLPASWQTSAALIMAARYANPWFLSPTCGSSTSQRCATGTSRCVSFSASTSSTLMFLQQLASAFPAQLSSKWRGTSYCQWPGIVCSADSNYPFITVDLSGYGLEGSIPAAVGSSVADGSVYVEHLILRNNKGLTGEIPARLDAALPYLRTLDVGQTSLFGPVPNWASFTYLERVRIADTGVCMDLPGWSATNFPWLAYVDLSNNNLRGSLDASWNTFLGSNARLQSLNLRGNAFCGCLPSTEWQTNSLTRNALDASTMATLSTSSCAITNACGNANQQCIAGTAPLSSREATLSFLQAVREAFPEQLGRSWTGENYCSGTWSGVKCVTDSDTQTQVVHLELGGKALEGTLPQVPLGIIGSRVLVRSMDFSSNTGVKGTLPVTWGSLTFLRELNLANTEVSGPIPDDWGGLASLEAITISKTKVCRGLPNWSASTMRHLRYVDFSSNYLIGGLSAEFGTFGDQLTHFDVSSNIFCGCVPSEWTSSILLEAIKSTNPRMLDAEKCANENGCRASSLRCYDGSSQQEVFVDPSVTFLELLRDTFLKSTSTVNGSAAISKLRTWSSASTSSRTDYCNGWEGVSCDDLDGFSVDLSGTGLAGTLPPLTNIGTASTIAVISINLSGNPGVQGTLPISWSALENLRRLDLSGTSLSSSIPVDWQGLASLRSLSLANTGVCGELPSWDAAKLASIVSLDLSDSKLSGSLTDSWGEFALSRLTTLDLTGNSDLCRCVPDDWLAGYPLRDAVVKAFGPAGSNAQCGNCPQPPVACITPGDGELPVDPTSHPPSSAGDSAATLASPVHGSFATALSLVVAVVVLCVL